MGKSETGRLIEMQLPDWRAFGDIPPKRVALPSDVPVVLQSGLEVNS